MNKYGAKRTEVDGIVFHSKREAARYSELKLLERAGEIRDLNLQPEFRIEVNGQYIGLYRGDFKYRTRAGLEITEDVKGVRTELYKWKKRLVEAVYEIVIVEV
jgi:hypothetical protein